MKLFGKYYQDAMFIEICEITIHAHFLFKNNDVSRIQGMCRSDLHCFWIFFRQGRTVQRFIIIGYV